MATRVCDWPAVPANNGTIVLFATHDRLAGGSGTLFRGMSGVRGLHFSKIDGFEIVFLRHNKASAANGIRLYAYDDGGAWRETDLKDDLGVATLGAVQVGALSSGAEFRLLLDVARYRKGWACEYTAGADNPENWNGVLTLHHGVEGLLR